MRWIGKGTKRYQSKPMERSLTRARDRIRYLTRPQLGNLPVKDVIGGVNRFLKGWGNYFNKGTPSKAFQKVNWHVGNRMIHFLERRSQRGYKKPQGSNWYEVLNKLGLFVLSRQAFKKGYR